MRIGIDATALPPKPVGAGNYIIQLIRALAGREHPHQLVVFAHESGYRLIDLPASERLEWMILPDQPPARRLIWEQVAFPRAVQRARVDLLHSLHYTRPLVLNCPSVVTFHDMTFFLFPHLHTRAKRLFFPPAIRQSARQAQALIAVSECTRQDAIRVLNLPPEKVFTVPLGVRRDFHPITDEAVRAAVAQRYNLPGQFILYVGAVEPRKNLPLLLRAYRALLDQGPAPALVVVGPLGWMYADVFRQIKTLELENQVKFAGYVSAQDLPIVYNLASVFVYPSIYEGFGLPPLEAMACGTPVITTAISSMPENVGDSAILVPPQDEQALTAAMRDLLNNPALRRELAQKGPQRAALFPWERTAQGTLQVYQTVLNRQIAGQRRPA